MNWDDVKAAIRKSGLRHSVLNKGGDYETLHVEQPDGNFIRDTHLYKYEAHEWMYKLKLMGVQYCNQLDLFA